MHPDIRGKKLLLMANPHFLGELSVPNYQKLFYSSNPIE
jgi:hypothetical protein